MNWIKRNGLLVGISTISLLQSLYTNAQTASDLNLNAHIQTDTSVLTGKLSNGLTYYIKPNPKPSKKVELRLVLNAGAVLENDNQQGLAHFMEHMEFNGLKHFPKNKLVDYLEKIGVGFGSDLNANTAFDRTYYILPIPTDNPTNLPTGMQILRDWADGASISTNEVNAERNVILEELKMRDRNASTRMMHQYLKNVLNGSKYADRLPSGKDSIVAHGNPQLIRDFYHDWYRPDLMSVIIVGDITKEKGLQYINQYFGSLKNPQNEKKRIFYSVKPYTQSAAQVVTDKEATGYGINILFPATEKDTTRTLADVKKDFIEQILNTCINKRFNLMSQKTNPAFSGAGLDMSGTVGAFAIKQKNIELDITPNKDIKTSIDSSIYTLLQVKNYGLTENEVQIVRNNILAGIENAYNERDKEYSASYAEEYATDFMGGQVPVSIATYYKYAKALIPTISLDEINQYAKTSITNTTNLFTLLTAPDSGNVVLPQATELKKWVADAFLQKVNPYVNETIGDKLIDSLPAAGTIVKEEKDSKLKTTTYTLSNNIKVTVLPTNYQSDQIIMSGIKPGGSNNFPVSEKLNTTFLTDIISTMGYGKFTPTQLNDFLSGKNAGVSASLGKISAGVSGNSSVKDLRTLMELTYLTLMQPRKDTALLDNFKEITDQMLPNQLKNPSNLFSDTLVKTFYGNSPLAPIVLPSVAQVNSLDADTLLNLYRSIFSSADGFHFYFTGNVDADSIKPLLCKYLAVIPTNGLTKSFADNGLRPIDGTHRLNFYKGNDQKSSIQDMYYGKFDYTPEANLQADLLGQILTIKVIQIIREKLGYIYSGGVNATISQFPYGNYSVSADLPCDPKNVENILKAYDGILKDMKENGPSDIDLAKVKKTTLESYKQQLTSNSYWESLVKNCTFYGEKEDWWLQYDKNIQSVTKEDIKKMAQKLLTNNHFTAVSYPESK